MSAVADATQALFVLEQTLGNAVYGSLVERAAAEHPRIEAAVVRVGYEQAPALARLPVVGNWTLRSSLIALSAVARARRTRRTDVMFVHTQVTAMLLGRAMRTVPTVLSTDATPAAFDSVAGAYGHAAQPAQVESLKSTLVGRVYRRAAAVVAWSAWTEASLRGTYGVDPARIHRIPPGVDLATFHPAPGRRRQGPMRVLFVGGDFERKGGLDLVAASRELPGRVELHVVTPHAPAGLPAGVRVHAGLRPGSPELAELFGQCDVLALPTHGDAHPHVVVEAMASGLPVVSTRVGAIPELVADGERGVLVEPGDVRGLTAALLSLANEPLLVEHLGSSALRYARQHQDGQANLSRLMTLLRAVSKAAASRETVREAAVRHHPSPVTAAGGGPS